MTTPTITAEAPLPAPLIRQDLIDIGRERFQDVYCGDNHEAALIAAIEAALDASEGDAASTLNRASELTAARASDGAQGEVVQELLAAALDALRLCQSSLDELMGDTDPLEDTPELLACQAATEAIVKIESALAADQPKEQS